VVPVVVVGSVGVEVMIVVVPEVVVTVVVVVFNVVLVVVVVVSDLAQHSKSQVSFPKT
jgi:hypothetical protein